MINAEFIKTKHKVFEYCHKAETKSSFILSSGPINYLPRSLYFGPYIGKPGSRPAKYAIKGTYTKSENGIYYDMDKRKVHTKIMQNPNFPQFIGWGEINERFGIYDLLIFFSSNNCKESFEIHHFTGLAKIDYLEEVCKYLQHYQNNKSPKNGLLLGGKNDEF
jgi:hypothetical protein